MKEEFESRAVLGIRVAAEESPITSPTDSCKKYIMYLVLEGRYWLVKELEIVVSSGRDYLKIFSFPAPDVAGQLHSHIVTSV